MMSTSMLTAEEVCEVPPASFGRRLLLVKEILAVVGAAAGASGSRVAVDGGLVWTDGKRWGMNEVVTQRPPFTSILHP